MCAITTLPITPSRIIAAAVSYESSDIPWIPHCRTMPARLTLRTTSTPSLIE